MCMKEVVTSSPYIISCSADPFGGLSKLQFPYILQLRQTKTARVLLLQCIVPLWKEQGGGVVHREGSHDIVSSSAPK